MEHAAAELGISIPDGKLTDEVFDFQESLNRESDRGSALLAAAFLDELLADLLRSFFVEDSKVANELLDGTSGLATFSARIDLAYSLGLISPLARRDLHLIRKIRNDFAHTAIDLGFAHPPIAARCSELHHDILNDKLPPRRKSVRVVLGVGGAIKSKVLSCARRQSEPDLHFEDPRLHERMRELVDEMLRDEPSK